MKAAALVFAASLLGAGSCASPAPTNGRVTTCGQSEVQKEPHEMWPETVDDAAKAVVNGLSPEDRELVANTPRSDLIRFHHGWGTGIRNGLGLWRGNDALLADCGCVHPDNCSMQIIGAVWDRLHAEQGARVVTPDGETTPAESVGRRLTVPPRSFRLAEPAVRQDPPMSEGPVKTNIWEPDEPRLTCKDCPLLRRPWNPDTLRAVAPFLRQFVFADDATQVVCTDFLDDAADLDSLFPGGRVVPIKACTETCPHAELATGRPSSLLTVELMRRADGYVVSIIGTLTTGATSATSYFVGDDGTVVQGGIACSIVGPCDESGKSPR